MRSSGERETGEHEHVEGSQRRFVLAHDPERAPPTLVDEDVQHALRVLRVAVGDRIVGLDGRGAAWPLVVRSVARRALELESAGDPVRAPRPGTPGSGAPAVEVALSLPKGSRAEDCLGRLTQLGVTLVTPLTTRRSPPHARDAGAARLERLARAGREATKQCGRLWFPELGAPCELETWLRARTSGPAAPPLAWLDPYAAETLLAWPAPRVEASLALAIGPEGGFDPAEEASLAASGAFRARLGGHVLRLETAAEAALAVVMTLALDARR